MREDIKERIEMIKRGEIPEGYKKTKLGVVPKEWEVKCINEIADTIGGGTPDTKKSFYWEGNIPWISSADLVIGDTESVSISRYITADAIKNSAAKKCQKGTILVVSRVGVGKIAVAPCELCTSQDFTNLINVKGNVFFILNSIKKGIERKINALQGTSIKGLTVSEIKNLLICYPKIDEQNCIEKVINTINLKIKLIYNLLCEKKKYKKWLMQNLILGKRRLSGFVEKWENVKLGKTILEHSEKNKGNKILNVKSINNKLGFINQSEQFGKIVASNDLSNYKIVEKGDIAYNPSRINVGSIAIYEDDIQGIISPMYIVIKTSDKLLGKYLMHYTRTNDFYQQMKAQLSGSVRDSLKFEDLCSIRIKLPSREEQESIIRVLEIFDKEIELLENKLKQTKLEKKALMQLLLSGIVRVN